MTCGTPLTNFDSHYTWIIRFRPDFSAPLLDTLRLGGLRRDGGRPEGDGVPGQGRIDDAGRQHEGPVYDEYHVVDGNMRHVPRAMLYTGTDNHTKSRECWHAVMPRTFRVFHVFRG